MGGDERRSSNKDRRSPSGETKAGLYVPFKFQDGKVVDDAGNIYDVHEATERIPWVTARQYPPPHQYVILCVRNRLGQGAIGRSAIFRYRQRYWDLRAAYGVTHNNYAQPLSVRRRRAAEASRSRSQAETRLERTTLGVGRGVMARLVCAWG